MTDYTEKHMQEVWSWVHNQDRCVTAQTVALELGLPRSVASSLLQQLPAHKNQNDFEYEFTKYCLIEEAPNKSVIKLVKSTGVPSKDDTMMYSIALSKTESVETAHERDMATFREKLVSENESVLSSELHCHNVTPHRAVERTSVETIRHERIANIEKVAPTRVATKATVMRKTTTPSDFFAKETEKKKPEKKAANNNNNKTEKKKPEKNNADFFGKANGKTEKRKAATKRPVEKKKKKVNKKEAPKKKKIDIILSDSDDDTVDFSQPSPKKKLRPEEEKENAFHKTVGNADDFVGDEDEDEDFLAEEEERKKRIEAREKEQVGAKQHAARRRHQEAVRQEEEEVVEKQQASQQPAERKRKRRKKLVDKTSMDANGYLHTETVTVWEDVPTDEEEEPVAVRKPLHKAKPQKNMKQAGLMGFFKKK